ncbi:MAG: phage holin family protein [Armatimonadota bacterium]|nr:phage holin family protein [Armatimonadota bacterium]
MQILLRWIVSALALYLTVVIGDAIGRFSPKSLDLHFYIAPGLAGVQGVLVAVLLLATANATLRPLLKMLTMPLTCLTFGLFALVVNAFLFWLVGQFTPGFHVRGWQTSIFGSLSMSLVGGLLNNFVVSKREQKR